MATIKDPRLWTCQDKSICITCQLRMRVEHVFQYFGMGQAGFQERD